MRRFVLSFLIFSWVFPLGGLVVSHALEGRIATSSPETRPVSKNKVKAPALNSESQAESELEAVSEEVPPAGKLLFDLTDCVRMALRNNSEVRGAGYDIEDSRWKLKQAQPRGIPVLNYEYEAAPVPKDASNAISSFFSGDITMLNRVKIGIGVPVTTFGKIQMAQRLARNGIEASIEQKNKKNSEVVLKVKQLYYGILFARDLKGMLNDALKRLESEISKREGTATPADPVDLAKLKLTRYEVLRRFGEVQKKEELALEGLRITIGVDRALPFELNERHIKPVEFELKELSYYLEEAKRYRPDSKLLDIALQAKENEYRLEKRKLLPNLGAGAFFEMGRTVDPIINQGTTDDFNNPFNFTRAGFGLRLKGDFNWREAHALIKQKQAQYYKMSVTKDYAEEGLNLDLRDSYLSAKQSKVDLENAEKAYRLARQLVFLTKTNYDVGVGDKKDYGEALQSYLLMKGRYFESVFNYNVAVSTLISKIGYQYSP